jgi:hypothetical protein
VAVWLRIKWSWLTYASILSDDLTGHWSLSFSDIDFVYSKLVSMRLSLAIQLKFFVSRGLFTTDIASVVPADEISCVVEQLAVEAGDIAAYDFSSRTARRHCTEILQYFGFRRLKQADREMLARWTADDLCPDGQLRAPCWRACLSGAATGVLRRVAQGTRTSGPLSASAIPRRGTGRGEGLPLPETVALLKAALTGPDGPTGFDTMKGLPHRPCST